MLGTFWFILLYVISAAESEYNILDEIVDIFDVFDGIQKPCHLSCQATDGSSLPPVKNLSYKPSSNGCGTDRYDLHVDIPRFDECCDGHDLCYGECGRIRGNCDTEFEMCLLSKCREHGTIGPVGPCCGMSGETPFLRFRLLSMGSNYRQWNCFLVKAVRSSYIRFF